MNYTLNATLDAYATDAGPVIKKTMIDLPECTINVEDPQTRVTFMVAMLQGGSWGLFYAQGGDWNAFADGNEHNAEMLNEWMPDAIRDCVAAVAERIGESADEDMDWFTDWANAAEETLSDSRDANDYASDESLWIEYIDPDNTTPFESISYDERVKLAQSVIDSNT